MTLQNKFRILSVKKSVKKWSMTTVLRYRSNFLRRNSILRTHMSIVKSKRHNTKIFLSDRGTGSSPSLPEDTSRRQVNLPSEGPGPPSFCVNN